MTKQELISACLSIIAKVPLDQYGRRKWCTNVQLVGEIAALVIRHSHGSGATIHEIAAAIGSNATTINHFIRGRDSGGNKWADLHGAIGRAGLEPVTGL